jgi:hypothetical protein
MNRNLKEKEKEKVSEKGKFYLILKIDSEVDSHLKFMVG